jgi:hypothetical protein
MNRSPHADYVEHVPNHGAKVADNRNANLLLYLLRERL